MPVRTISEYLEKHNVNYRCYNHPPAVTALEIAESSHVPGHSLAKPVIVKADGLYLMAVLPAHGRIDLELLRHIVGADTISIATEQEFSRFFPLCEVGGMPALGRMYGMHVYLDQSLLVEDWLAFNAGTHTEILKMDLEEFQRIEHPTVCSFMQRH
ncbi:MAG: YbaK/EbsC family protein [Pseudomonadales bacterium]|nr:YbaK/EbsC family protein [Pseudomonadales bacterium]